MIVMIGTVAALTLPLIYQKQVQMIAADQGRRGHSSLPIPG